MKRLKQYLSDNWIKILVTSFVIFVALAVNIFSLNNNPPGVSLQEKQFISSSSSVQQMIDNPVNLIMKLPFFGLHQLDISTITIFRYVSVFFSLLFITVFYFYLRKHHTARVSVITTIILLTSSWYLHNARLALPLILIPLSIITILYIYESYDVTNKRIAFSVFNGIILGLLAYTTSIIFILFGLFLFSFFNKSKKYKTFSISFISFIITISPLIIALIINPDALKSLIGVNLIFEPIEWMKRLAVIPIYIFAKGPYEPILNLARLPLLDIVTSVLLILGGYSLAYKINESNIKRLLAIFVVCCLLFALGGTHNLVLLLTIIFIAIGYGVALLLQQWFTVFPKNPLIKNVGVILVVIAISLCSVYQLRKYFVAWPTMPATKLVFIDSSDK